MTPPNKIVCETCGGKQKVEIVISNSGLAPRKRPVSIMKPCKECQKPGMTQTKPGIFVSDVSYSPIQPGFKKL